MLSAWMNEGTWSNNNSDELMYDKIIYMDNNNWVPNQPADGENILITIYFDEENHDLKCIGAIAFKTGDASGK